MINYFHYRGQMRKELNDHCEEYYLASKEEMYDEYLTYRQYVLLKCIYWVMCLGHQKPDDVDRPTYYDMFNELKALMTAWEKGQQEAFKNIEKALKD